MPSSDEHLQRLGELRSDQGPTRRRTRLVALGALLAIGLAAAAVWALGPGLILSVGGDGASLRQRVLSWWVDAQSQSLRAPSSDPGEVSFRIEPGEGLVSVARRLAAAGLVRDADAFRRLAQVRGLDRQIQAGTSVLRRDMSASEVLDALLEGQAPSVRLTIPEGWRAEQVADVLAADGIADREEFLALVGEGHATQPIASDRPAGTGLEGYLFPDTYDAVPNEGARSALDRLLGNFERRVGPEMSGPTALAQPVLSPYEVVTLASIVEREAVLAEERPRIARVFVNRLAEPPYLLNADPTVQYALGFQPDQGQWWKRGLTQEDLATDSAYNTYLYPGLPPGPIASPGLDSIRAVLHPEPGDWRYFVANGEACDGSHLFAATWDEHLANVARYRGGGCGD